MADIKQLSRMLSDICADAIPADDHVNLLEKIQQRLPDTPFHLSLSRGGWYRVGAVVNAAGERVADKLGDWIEAEALELFEIVEKYKDSGYKVTRLNGTTHYFTASTGSDPDQFIQLEVEEITEVVDRNLIEADYYPETLEEFVEPDDFPRLSPVETIKRYYLFRRVTDIQDFIERMNKDSEFELPIQRWFKDWKRSSAAEKTLFCQQWVLALREYTDGYGEPRMEAKPMSTYGGAIDELDPDNTTRGSVLANAIHGVDRQLDYPMAWYFLMLSRKKVSPRIAEAIHNDMQGAYAYLPPRDLKILNEWIAAPYSV